MSNPINLSDLGTLIINEKNLPTRSQFDVLTNKYNQFINTVFLDTFGNLISWVKPTNIASITSLSSLPHNYIFVKNKSTRQRITFTSSSQLHNNVVSKMISSIQIIVNGITSNLDLTTSGIVIDRLNKTIDFNYTASSLLQHDIIVKLRNTNLLEIGSTISTNYIISVQSSKIIELEFPNIVTTIKNSPHDIADVTVGQTLSMTSTFSDTIHSEIISTVIVNDGTTSINALTNISDSSLNYSFTVSNDSDHSGIITLSYGNLENTYSWSSIGLLTATDDIYTFPNIVTYDGTTSNGYEPGIHLMLHILNNLVLFFAGGDHLHSDEYISQISLIQYKTGLSGNLVTVPSSDISINSATGVETITLANLLITTVDDIYFYIILKGPDGTVGSSLNIMVPNTEVYDNTFNIASEMDVGFPNSSLGSHLGMYLWRLNYGIVLGVNATIIVSVLNNSPTNNYYANNSTSFSSTTTFGSSQFLGQSPSDGNYYGLTFYENGSNVHGLRLDGLAGAGNMINAINSSTWTTHVITKSGNTVISYDLGETGSMSSAINTYTHGVASNYDTSVVLTDFFRTNSRNRYWISAQYKNLMIFDTVLTSSEIETYRTTPPAPGTAKHHFFTGINVFMDNGYDNMVDGVVRVATKTNWTYH